jgi:glutamate/tyrosine decarboxylase-like PLP-dependent enzyme
LKCRSAVRHRTDFLRPFAHRVGGSFPRLLNIIISLAPQLAREAVALTSQQEYRNMTFLKSPPSTPDAVADEYAATISGSSLPKYRIPEGSSDRRAVFDLVRDELFMDGNSRQNVATFCTTYADDEVRRLMDLSIDKNMIDKDEYPQTAEIEMRCVHMLADLWHAPKS